MITVISASLTSPVFSFIVAGLEAASLKPWINPGGNIRPQLSLHGEQRVDFETAQLPTLFSQLSKRSARGASELEPQVLVRQQTTDDSFNRSM
jgi:hypothetical protein